MTELLTLYKLLGPSADTLTQIAESKRLFEEYAEMVMDSKDRPGMKVRGVTLMGFEKMCLDRDVFTIRSQNNFINMASRNFLSMTDGEDAFTQEFQMLQGKID